MKRHWRTALLVVLASAGLVALAAAQRQRGQRNQAGATEFEINNVPYDGRFAFVRLRYSPSRSGFGQGGGYFGGINYWWDHDYPRADQHLTTMLREMTLIGTSRGSNVISIGSPDLFRYPLAYMSEPGWWDMPDEDAANLRAWFGKGGFMILDDFAGEMQLSNFQAQLLRVLPGARLVQLDESHPIFNSFFEIPDVGFAHPYSGVPAAFLGVYEDNDPSKRLLLIANYNNDIGESWEFSDTGMLPIDITNQAYKLGINYLVYAMTH
jgi:hypothetical protein